MFLSARVCAFLSFFAFLILHYPKSWDKTFFLKWIAERGPLSYLFLIFWTAVYPFEQ